MVGLQKLYFECYACTISPSEIVSFLYRGAKMSPKVVASSESWLFLPALIMVMRSSNYALAPQWGCPSSTASVQGTISAHKSQCLSKQYRKKGKTITLWGRLSNITLRPFEDALFPPDCVTHGCSSIVFYLRGWRASLLLPFPVVVVFFCYFFLVSLE